MKGRLHLTQEAKLQQRLLPLQLQLGKLLELNENAFRDFVHTAVEENPVLEIVNNDKSETEDSFSYDSDNHLNDDSDTTDYNSSSDYHENRSHEAYYGIAQEQESLYEFLSGQIADLSLDVEERDFALFLIGNLDNNGYFGRSLNALATDFFIERGIELPELLINKAWDTVRSLDPPGIGAVDLKDCLLLQLERKDGNDPVVSEAIEIIRNRFDINSFQKSQVLLSSKNQKPIISQEVLALIKKLNPKPGRQFTSGNIDLRQHYITPDFSVFPDIDIPGKLVVALLSYSPELSIDPIYIDILDDNQISTKEHSRKDTRHNTLYLKQRIDDARKLIDLVKMRQSTMLRIITAIATLQKEFFLSGDLLELKPMVLKDIAHITGDDLSVLSRVTSTRYVTTIGGTFALKDLFKEGITNKVGNDITQIHAENEIRKIIGRENPEKPFSDEKIAQFLNEKGIEIARRTVAKYRETAKIPSARERRIIKK